MIVGRGEEGGGEAVVDVAMRCCEVRNSRSSDRYSVLGAEDADDDDEDANVDAMTAVWCDDCKQWRAK